MPGLMIVRETTSIILAWYLPGSNEATIVHAPTGGSVVNKCIALSETGPAIALTRGIPDCFRFGSY